jgi:hypothetical protein
VADNEIPSARTPVGLQDAARILQCFVVRYFWSRDQKPLKLVLRAAIVAAGEQPPHEFLADFSPAKFRAIWPGDMARAG